MHRPELSAGPATATARHFRFALVGNPNSGKSSVFNQLTGLRQKVGNFPGVTVDKKIGKCRLPQSGDATLIDFPGTYSLYPTSLDERIVASTFCHPEDDNYPDAIVYIADVTHLEKHMLLFTQLRDIGLPIVLALNMMDIAQERDIQYDTAKLAKKLAVPVVAISGRTGEGLDALRQAMQDLADTAAQYQAPPPFYPLSQSEQEAAQRIRAMLPLQSDYQAVLLAHHYAWLGHLPERYRTSIGHIVAESKLEDLRYQVEETMRRYDIFLPIIRQAIRKSAAGSNSRTERADRLLTHAFWGPLLFFALMLLVFQAIYAWATYPMDAIEGLFSTLAEGLKASLPAAWYTDLLTDGVLAGLGGVLVFIPQIAILFFLISLLEEVGYMARAAYMFDSLMQRFGLNGRSIVALISGGACAIPAIMSTRTIGNWKERLITILVTPFISCSARIPVYTVLIAFVVPPERVLGVFNLQGLAFMGLYLLGIAAALGTAAIFKWVLKTNESSFLMLELPEYRTPVLRNVLLTVWEKVQTFILEAGKIILIISIALWVLATYGPAGKMAAADSEARQEALAQGLDEAATADLVAARSLEASFAGHLGKAIEPAIRPLGFDWKIGIALVTSFAAREVFVGTMATIYSIGSSDDELAVRARMAQELRPGSQEKVYNTATTWSLLLFYVFAMQCMSTLAVVRRETKSWYYALLQFTFMTGLAYLSSFLAYQWLS